MKKLYITFIAHLNEVDVPALKMFVVQGKDGERSFACQC